MIGLYFPNFSKYNLNSVPTPTSVSKSISKTKYDYTQFSPMVDCFARLQAAFRISELTRLVPAPVCSALWNDYSPSFRKL